MGRTFGLWGPTSRISVAKSLLGTSLKSKHTTESPSWTDAPPELRNPPEEKEELCE